MSDPDFLPAETDLLDALAIARWGEDAFGQPLAELRLVRVGSLRAVGNRRAVELVLAVPAATVMDALAGQAVEMLEASFPGHPFAVSVTHEITAPPARGGIAGLPGVKNLVVVASGKGGVGKSTVAVNLALALRDEGARAGLLDADVYGPSQPRLLGLGGAKPSSPDGKRMRPLAAHGLQAMSVGFLVDDAEAVIWRGPMATQALSQMATGTAWDDLDYLVVDLPPGTGDIPLSLAQRLPVGGAVIVTTPQDLALLDARKGVAMFKKLELPVLGIIENMAVFCCPHCGHETAIFGTGGGEKLAAEAGVGVLGRLPLEAGIRAESDSGTPTVAARPEAGVTQAYRAIARRMAAGLAALSAGTDRAFPSIAMTDD